MRINTNVPAINTQRNLSSIQGSLAKSVERLSSGLRINRAGDDAAGLTISEKLRGQVKGLNQAMRNAQDGISMIQTAEGGLNETHAILQRMRELAVQASNDTLQDTDRAAIGAEVTALNSEIDRIATQTQFNGKNLLNGSLSTVAGAGEIVDGTLLTTGNVNVAVSKLDVSGAKAGTSFTFTAGANTDEVLLTAVSGNVTVGTATAKIANMTTTGTSAQTLDFSALGVKLTLNGFNANATGVNIRSALVAGASDSFITAAGNSSASFQIGANAGQSISVAVADTQVTKIGTGGSATAANLNVAVTTFSGASTVANAQDLIKSLDAAIANVSTNRSNLGAVQNRLEHTIENLAVSSENLTASESRIRDADMASEMVGFTRSNVLQQAATSILAQANQLPQGVLSLLR